MPTGAGSPFASAVEVRRGYREGRLDPRRYGAFPGSPFAGLEFLRGHVVVEVAHRHGDELLLWDDWGVAGDDVDPVAAHALADEVADLLLRRDAGDAGAESELASRYRQDDRLHPGRCVVQHSPYGDEDVVVDLRQGTSAAG